MGQRIVKPLSFRYQTNGSNWYQCRRRSRHSENLEYSFREVREYRLRITSPALYGTIV